MKAQRTTEQKLLRARTQLLLNHPFFGTLCVRLKLEADGHMRTMATDGRRIRYSPDFVERLTPAELEGVLAHEVLHCALAHHCRCGSRDAGIWNEAADYAVNPILLANGVTLPRGVLVDPAFADLSAEEIYARLVRQRQDSEKSGTPPSPGQDHATGAGPASQNSPQSSQPPGAGPPRIGEVMDAAAADGSSPSQAERARQEREWQIASKQALTSAKACGREPSGLERALDQQREGRVDWRSVLRDFVSATRPSDYSWTRPNRRYLSRGLYLPSVIRAGIGEIVVAVDTSGSVGAEELAQFAGEITSILDDAQPDVTHVVYCDAAVQATQEFAPGEPVELKPSGGGGTDFRPAFDWVEEQGIEPACLIYLTDLACHSYPVPPPYPVLWVTDSRRTAEFGETLRITPDD